jgi:hypothetical protein
MLIRALTILFLSALVAAPCLAQDTMTAPQDIAALRARAESGEAAFQAYFGYLYSTGAGGLEKSDDEAFKWYKKAADQGYAPAQYNLGVFYDEGRGVPQNHASAYFWLHLAAASGKKDYAARRDRSAQHLTLVQLSELKKRAMEWRAARPPSPAAATGTLTVPWIRVPSAVQKTITGRIGAGSMIDKVERTSAGNKGVYRATVNGENGRYFIEVGDNGDLIGEKDPENGRR